LSDFSRLQILRNSAALLILVFLCALPELSLGHAFPEHAEPKVGSTVPVSPLLVRIWFDSDLEPVFSSIIVQDANGKKIDKGDGHVDHSDATLLEASLPSLPPGAYRVIWDVVARDGHRTNGDYTFVIK
jgi:methionine-rich copper-binding protein CopC